MFVLLISVLCSCPLFSGELDALCQHLTEGQVHFYKYDNYAARYECVQDPSGCIFDKCEEFEIKNCLHRLIGPVVSALRRQKLRDYIHKTFMDIEKETLSLEAMTSQVHERTRTMLGKDVCAVDTSVCHEVSEEEVGRVLPFKTILDLHLEGVEYQKKERVLAQKQACRSMGIKQEERTEAKDDAGQALMSLYLGDVPWFVGEEALVNTQIKLAFKDNDARALLWAKLTLFDYEVVQESFVHKSLYVFAKRYCNKPENMGLGENTMSFFQEFREFSWKSKSCIHQEYGGLKVNYYQHSEEFLLVPEVLVGVMHGVEHIPIKTDNFVSRGSEYFRSSPEYGKCTLKGKSYHYKERRSACLSRFVFLFDTLFQAVEPDQCAQSVSAFSLVVKTLFEHTQVVYSSGGLKMVALYMLVLFNTMHEEPVLPAVTAEDGDVFQQMFCALRILKNTRCRRIVKILEKSVDGAIAAANILQRYADSVWPDVKDKFQDVVRLKDLRKTTREITLEYLHTPLDSMETKDAIKLLIEVYACAPKVVCAEMENIFPIEKVNKVFSQFSQETYDRACWDACDPFRFKKIKAVGSPHPVVSFAVNTQEETLVLVLPYKSSFSNPRDFVVYEAYAALRILCGVRMQNVPKELCPVMDTRETTVNLAEVFKVDFWEPLKVEKDVLDAYENAQKFSPYCGAICCEFEKCREKKRPIGRV